MMTDLVRRFFRDDGGATAIEYAIIASGIAAAIVTAVGSLGGGLGTKYNNVSNAIN